MRITQEEHREACRADLYDFLTRRHPNETKEYYGSIVLRSNDHVWVGKGFHGYTDFRTGETGNAVKYLQTYLGYNYRDAVLALLGRDDSSETEDKRDGGAGNGKSRNGECRDNGSAGEEKEKPEHGHDVLSLPEKLDGPYKNLYAYLTGRNIPAELIKELTGQGLIYQTAEHNNIVFVTPEKDYAEIRGTNTYADNRCRFRDKCPDYKEGEYAWCTHMRDCGNYKKDPFHGCIKNSRPDGFWYYKPCRDMKADIAYVCEGAIDAISLSVLQRGNGTGNTAVYVSIGGVHRQAAIDRLKKRIHTVLAVDNDEAGQRCRDKNPDLTYILPNGKDWNEDLKKNNLVAACPLI